MINRSSSLTKNVRILVTSSSNKIPLISAAIIAAKKVNQNSLVYSGDVSNRNLSFYVSKEFLKMPSTIDKNVNKILDLCKNYKINVIIPTRDGELLFWAKYKDLFMENGISALVSSKNSVKICLDKLLFYKFGIQHGYPMIQTELEMDFLKGQRFVVKSRFGSGSRNIGINLTRSQVVIKSADIYKPIYQPYISGEEISIDAWLSKKNIVKGVVLRKRELVIDGESQITTTFRNEILENLAKNFLETIGLEGHVVLQVKIDSEGNFNILECNARLGGASTASMAAGLDSIYWSLLEYFNYNIDEVTFSRSDKEVTLKRIPMDFFI